MVFGKIKGVTRRVGTHQGRAAALLALATLLSPAEPVAARVFVDFESGAVGAGYNDVRIPNETGTLFSLTDDLATESSAFFRFRGGATFNDRHTVSVLIAPLELDAAGSVPRPISFEGVEFPANTALTGSYRFDSYRVTYLYDFKRSGRLRAGIGASAKIRDAEIRLQGGGLESSKPDTGFVPLIAFRFDFAATDRLRLLVRGEALASTQGRAEDVFFGVAVAATEQVWVKGGYRLVEGGADVDEVYNFALLNYGSIGVILTL